ncbi:MAG: hypothetical protein FWH37_09275 [Candidatus Bathyarchaeota archaeon]|nr:hypothetical protein [Candidatus Termiticorpusculum sp.]
MTDDIEQAVEEFMNDLKSHKLKRDVLVNSSEEFCGKKELQDYERFEKFVQTPLFKKIMEL